MRVLGACVRAGSERDRQNDTDLEHMNEVAVCVRILCVGCVVLAFWNGHEHVWRCGARAWNALRVCDFGGE